MHSTADINAIIDRAKQQRADYVASKLQWSVLPIALATIVSLAVVALAGQSTDDQAHNNPVVETIAHHG